MSRTDRLGCEFHSYLPDPLLGWETSLPTDLVVELNQAEAAIRRLNEVGITHPNLEGLARFLLRAESVASSKIEGLEAGARRLLDAEIVIARGGEAADRVAVEVLANIAAMEAAVELGSNAAVISLENLLEVHRILMEGSPTPSIGGVIRTKQNWIGGSSYNPCSAVFVPPPPESVGDLLEDLITYINDDQHPVLLQAAIAHAQFETIHPFADGNGRTGRALIHIVLRRRLLAPAFVPPISLIFATLASEYVAGLTDFRHFGEPNSAERAQGAQRWVSFFAQCVLRSCTDAQLYASAIEQCQLAWRTKLGPVRAGSAVELLINVLAGAPVVSVESAAGLIGRSEMRTGRAITRLVDAGVLRQRNIGKQRYRVFEATSIVDLFTGFERALASPLGDT